MPLLPLAMAAIAGVKALTGGAQFLKGGSQEKKGEEMFRTNKRPVYKAQAEVLENNRIAASKAAAGMSDAAKQVYLTESDRQGSSGIDAILRGGGSVNNIADLYSATQTGISRMALIDEEMRSRNLRDFYGTNAAVGNEHDKEFQINEWGPYANKAQAAAALLKQGEENKWKGINTFVGAASDAVMAGMYAKEGRDVFTQGSAGHREVSLETIRPESIDRSYRTNYGTNQIERSRQLTPLQLRYPGLSNPSYGAFNYNNVG